MKEAAKRSVGEGYYCCLSVVVVVILILIGQLGDVLVVPSASYASVISSLCASSDGSSSRSGRGRNRDDMLTMHLHRETTSCRPRYCLSHHSRTPLFRPNVLYEIINR